MCRKQAKIFFSAAILFSFMYHDVAAQFTGKPQYRIRTYRDTALLGDIHVELFPAIAPKHVKNFDSLVSKVFYDTTAFHRVIPGFVIQGGDPNSRHGPKSTWGFGDPSQPKVNAEFSSAKHKRGTFAAARGPNINSATSQFYICVAPQPSLDGNYTIYGQVTSGMNIADTIVTEPRDSKDCPLIKIEMFVTYTGSNDTLPKVPVLDLPLNGDQNIGTVKQLKWFKASDDIMYHLEVSLDSTFSSTFFKSQDVGANYDQLVGLQDSSTYYWRVKATNGGSWSAYSQTWKFHTIGFTAVNELSFEGRGYRLWQNIPNPTSGATSVKYLLPGKERVSIRLYDAAGKEVAVLVDAEMNKGEHEVSVDLRNLPAGAYIYTMHVAGVSESKSILINK